MKVTVVYSFCILFVFGFLGAAYGSTPDHKNAVPQTDTCANMIIDNLELIEKSSKSVLVKYEIRNVGNDTLVLTGPTDEQEDNVAIQAYLSGDKVFNKGDMELGRVIVSNKQLKHLNGLLLPGQTFLGFFKIDITKKSIYMNNLILQVDPVQFISECDRTDNTDYLLLR